MNYDCQCYLCQDGIDDSTKFSVTVNSLMNKKGDTIREWADKARRAYQTDYLSNISRGPRQVNPLFDMSYTYDPEEDPRLALIDAMYDLTQNLLKLRKANEQI